jgi:hypothetical protein
MRRVASRRSTALLSASGLAGLLIALPLAFGACSGTSNGTTSASDAAAERTVTVTDSGASRAGDAKTPDATSDAPVVNADTSVEDAAEAGRSFSTDRTLFFGNSRCAIAGVQLCEDFESGMLDTSTWTVSGTVPVIDGLEAARGTKALHITQDGNGLSYIKESKTFPEANDTYFGRVFVYFKSLPAAPLTYAHWTILAGSGTQVDGEIRVSGQFSSGQSLFGVGTDNRVQDSGTGDWTNSDKDPNNMPSPVPIGTWVCIEWMHKGDTSETRFYWDDTEHPSLYTSPTMHGGNSNPYILPQFTNVWVGWQEYQTTTETFELWVDEIAIDSQRIGCVL